MEITHFNDGKGKFQSHEIRIKEDQSFYNQEYSVFSHDITAITGYGQTKEEALDDFKKKLTFMMGEYKVFYEKVMGMNPSETSIIEVDCLNDEL